MRLGLREKIKVGHVAAHVGGGVGSVLKDLFRLSEAHGIENILFCLDKCETNFAALQGATSAFHELAFEQSNSFRETLAGCDVILIHYWNHPLMAQFLSGVQLPPCRLLFWCHNSGLYEPHIIPNYLARMARKIVFTSRCSLKAPNIPFLATDKLDDISVVHSTRSLKDFLAIGVQRPAPLKGKDLLYIGTVSMAKMHPASAEIFASLSRMGYVIRVVGGPDHEALATAVASLGCSIQVFGRVNNLADFYRNADVFIYPLRNDHYGTGEQVILEAMASGLPVVAFANPAEKAILKDGVDSILVSSTGEFIEAVSGLINDPARMLDMSRRSVSSIQNNFNAQAMTDDLVQIFHDLLGFEKLEPKPPTPLSKCGNELSLYALNSFLDEGVYESVVQDPDRGVDVVYCQIKPDLDDWSNAIKWLGSSKSTPFHYLRYFPHNSYLQRLAQLIQNQTGFLQNPWLARRLDRGIHA